MAPTVSSLDHLVLTVADIRATIQFYSEILGMQIEMFSPQDGTLRHAMKFGDQKINLHQVDNVFKPNARLAGVGSADLCFLSETSLNEWRYHLQKQFVEIEEGPIERSGAVSKLVSIYLRDPDGNLIEISNQIK